MASNPRTIAPTEVRSLLRKLRDLNLSAQRIAVSGGRLVTIAGCSSLDAPAESGVRYRLVLGDGSERCLALAWSTGKLEIDLGGAGGVVAKALRVDLSTGPDGRVLSRALAARVDPSTVDPRAIEHFLRRAVRAIFAAPVAPKRA